MTPQKKKVKEIFDMVYQWGRVGIEVDENAPTYQDAIDQLLEIAQMEYEKRNKGK